MTANELQPWLAEARRGTRIIYHQGDLSFDRSPKPGRRERTAEEREVDLLGRVAWDASEAGKVALTRKKLGKDTFAYMATRL